MGDEEADSLARTIIVDGEGIQLKLWMTVGK